MLRHLAREQCDQLSRSEFNRDVALTSVVIFV